ncbi:MAG: FAD-dependent oxidoreductase [Deltaproteobacteria bacterium]|nr:FAD-dependent oxidoreductase [Deltaproteobacteria bacterium]
MEEHNIASTGTFAQSSWWEAHAPIHLGYLATNFPCRAACPVGTNAGGYVSLVAQGHYAEAYALARGPNPFASVCGRICSHPCEAACRRASLDAAIQIRALKRFVNERHGVESAPSDEERSARFQAILAIAERPRPQAPHPGRVAVVGAGPAGLACAHDLRLMGHEVVVFDAAPVAGGMMRLGIPDYRLPRPVLDGEVDFIRWLGVEIRLGSEVGRDLSFAELASGFDAVFLAVGCRRGKSLRIPGADLQGVLTAVDFLVNANLGHPIEIGERVLVVGGGSVSFDVARTARRFGGTALPDEEHHNLAVDAAVMAARRLRRHVTMVALESRAEMPADPSEIEEGAEEGIHLINRRGPKEVLGPAGHVTALRTLDVARVFDEKGRFAPEMVPGTEREIPCDTLILAVGQVADLSFLGTEHGVETTPRGLVQVDPATLATSRQGVYAGGDVAFGPRIAISAIADGRRAARSIDTYLTGRTDPPPRYGLRVYDTFGYEHPFARGDYEKVPRHRLPVIAVQHRAQRVEVEQVLDEAVAREEGSRCLHCWINTIFDSSRMDGSECIQCGGCVDVCPEQCIDLVSLLRVAQTEPDAEGLRLPDGSPVLLTGEDRAAGAALIKDETLCIRCGLCARRCPVRAITMQAFYRMDEGSLVSLAEASL